MQCTLAQILDRSFKKKKRMDKSEDFEECQMTQISSLDDHISFES